ncbi:MAG: sodium:alanine symporter family protein [Elusimicrobiaceae bacterium]|nr:sodium:alanine symporter family protein [Elusimicrobiaceae bacterium]
METLLHYVNVINGFIWGPPMIILIFGLGIYFTFKLGFIQKYTFKAISLSLSKDEGAGTVSSFASLAMMIGATVGTGSILGVTTAVAEGGPGAVFWIVLAGLFNFVIKYCECTAAVKYRVRRDGEYVGGPMYVMTRVLKMKWLAVVFAFGTIFMALTAGAALQTNSIADVLREGYSLNPWIIGFIVAVFAGIVTIGGVKRIAAYSEWLVPLMGGAYLFIALIILIMNWTDVPLALWQIVSMAFTGKAALGGAVGVGVMAAFKGALNAIGMGVSRSVMSTEAGLGSASIAASAAQTKSAAKMGIISATSVFWTVFICVLSGLVVVLAGDWQNPDVFAANLCNSAFKTVPYIGTPILIFSLIIFSFTTLIGWSYYGEKAFQFLGCGKWTKTWRVFYIVVSVIGGGLGTTFSLGWKISADAFEVGLSTRFAWGLTVLMMTLMTLPNIYMLWRLRHKLQKETQINLHKVV